ncbi:MAG: nitroreductase family protein [Deltaproteobacteria bacterium]|nr:nitroreductase family protein [Deltaproteobacteria bacterium]
MAMVKLDPPPQLNMSLGEAMFTQRAIRRLKPDPISDEDIRTLMDAAAKAPNARNEHRGRFLVVRDRAKIRKFAELYAEAWWAKQPEGWSPENAPPGDKHLAPMRLAEAMKDVPVVVLAVSTSPGNASSVLPAAQNLMLAARALGIGSVLTTLHPCVTDRIHELFGIPSQGEVHCCIPLGYPEGRFGTTARLPTSETTYYEEWGKPPPWE